tara:strand:- start:3481 stop:4332 length:852 start_codon:yes stop_codon:yes gene_type:complete
MSASRDDFIIAIRSAFLKKENKQRFSLVGLIFSSVVLIILSNLNFVAINYLKSSLNEIVYRISFVVSIPEKQLQKSINLVNEHVSMYGKYKDMENKIRELENNDYNSNFLKSENSRLKRLIDEYITESDELVAKVLLDKDSPFLKSLIVNKGSKDKVSLGMAVLDENYLVGKIVEVNYTTSRVLLISDLNSKIPVIIEPGNVQSILSGSGKDQGVIQYFRSSREITSDNIVFTSGSGGIFKAGIPIGKIENVQTNKNYNTDFFSNLDQLTFVKLVSYQKESKN